MKKLLLNAFLLSLISFIPDLLNLVLPFHIPFFLTIPFFFIVLLLLTLRYKKNKAADALKLYYFPATIWLLSLPILLIPRIILEGFSGIGQNFIEKLANGLPRVVSSIIIHSVTVTLFVIIVTVIAIIIKDKKGNLSTSDHLLE